MLHLDELELIFRKLPLAEKLNARLVCKYWYDIITNVIKLKSLVNFEFVSMTKNSEPWNQVSTCSAFRIGPCVLFDNDAEKLEFYEEIARRAITLDISSEASVPIEFKKHLTTSNILTKITFANTEDLQSYYLHLPKSIERIHIRGGIEHNHFLPGVFRHLRNLGVKRVTSTKVYNWIGTPNPDHLLYKFENHKLFRRTKGSWLMINSSVNFMSSTEEKITITLSAVTGIELKHFNSLLYQGPGIQNAPYYYADNIFPLKHIKKGQKRSVGAILFGYRIPLRNKDNTCPRNAVKDPSMIHELDLRDFKAPNLVNIQSLVAAVSYNLKFLQLDQMDLCKWNYDFVHLRKISIHDVRAANMNKFENFIQHFPKIVDFEFDGCEIQVLTLKTILETCPLLNRLKVEFSKPLDAQQVHSTLSVPTKICDFENLEYTNNDHTKLRSLRVYYRPRPTEEMDTNEA